jgi:hypothetical protein
VVLVRPWTDAHAGSGCCSGDARHGVCLEERLEHHHAPDPSATRVGEAYRALRAQLPEVDVQIVAASNTPYLLPTTYRAARPRMSRFESLRQATRSTTAGSVLVDGVRVGDVDELGVAGVLAAVRAELSASHHAMTR